MAYSARFSLIAIIDGKDMHRNIFAWATANITKNAYSDADDKNFTLSESDGTPVKSKIVTFNCARTANGIKITNWGKLVKGSTYTISLYAKADKANQIVHYPFVVNQTTRSWSTQNVSTDWVRLYYSFVAKEEAPMIIFYPETAVNNVQVCGIKVEEGDEMTDFCLNEQDLKGDKGDSPYIIHTSTDAIIWNQEGNVTTNEDGTITNTTKWPNITIIAYLEKDGENVGGSLSYSKVSGNYSVSVQYVSQIHAYIFHLSSPVKIDGESELWTNGMFRISYDFGNGTKIDKDIPIALNALGTWKMSVINDTMSAVSKKKVTYYDKDNNPQTDTLETALAQSSKSISAAVKGNGEVLSGIGLTKDGINCFGKQFTWGYTNTNGKNQTVLSIDGKTGNAKFTGDVVAKSFSTTNNTFVADENGNITCVSGTFNNIKSDNGTFTNATMTNVKVEGSISSPWHALVSEDDFDKYDNLYASGFASTGLPFSEKCDGRVIRITNNSSSEQAITTNRGIFLDLDGNSSYSLKFKPYEMIILIGCPTMPILSWRVICRIPDLYSAKSHKGLPVRSLAIGRVELSKNNNGIMINIAQSTFDGQQITCKRNSEGKYSLTIPTNWTSKALHVMLTPYGFEYEGESNSAKKPSHVLVESISGNVINIFAGDDYTPNDTSFFFEIKELGTSQF